MEQMKKSWSVRLEALVQHAATVEVEAATLSEAVAKAMEMAGVTRLLPDEEACPPYVHSATRLADGFDYALSTAKHDSHLLESVPLGQTASGRGLESLPAGLLDSRDDEGARELYRLNAELHCGAADLPPLRAKLLLDAGADVAWSYDNGSTTLHAAAHGRFQATRVLLYAAATDGDLRARDAFGETPAKAAFAKGGAAARAMLSALRARGLPTLPEDMHVAILRGAALQSSLARLMTAEGLREVEKKGYSPGHAASAELARREARELRKASKQPKAKPAASRGRL